MWSNNKTGVHKKGRENGQRQEVERKTWQEITKQETQIMAQPQNCSGLLGTAAGCKRLHSHHVFLL